MLQLPQLSDTEQDDDELACATPEDCTAPDVHPAAIVQMAEEAIIRALARIVTQLAIPWSLVLEKVLADSIACVARAPSR